MFCWNLDQTRDVTVKPWQKEVSHHLDRDESRLQLRWQFWVNSTTSFFIVCLLYLTSMSLWTFTKVLMKLVEQQYNGRARPTPKTNRKPVPDCFVHYLGLGNLYQAFLASRFLFAYICINGGRRPGVFLPHNPWHSYYLPSYLQCI